MDRPIKQNKSVKKKIKAKEADSIRRPHTARNPKQKPGRKRKTEKIPQVGSEESSAGLPPRDRRRREEDARTETGSWAAFARFHKNTLTPPTTTHQE